jgi:hypothetical protein
MKIIITFFLIFFITHTKANMKPTYIKLPGTPSFTTKNNQFGQISMVKVTERRARGGTVLVIPLIPVPIAGESHDVQVERLYFTQKDGETLALNTGTGLRLSRIMDAYYFNEEPFKEYSSFNFLLDESYSDQLSNIAHVIKENKSDLENLLKKKINAVAIVQKESVAPDTINLFVQDQVAPNLEFLIDFNFEKQELQINYHLKENGKFKDYSNYFGTIFFEDKIDLLEEIKKLNASNFKERKFPKPPPVKGIEHHLMMSDKSAPHPTIEQVIAALKELPQMKSKGTQIVFRDYYKRKQELMLNPKHYLL